MKSYLQKRLEAKRAAEEISYTVYGISGIIVWSKWLSSVAFGQPRNTFFNGKPPFRRRGAERREIRLDLSRKVYPICHHLFYYIHILRAFAAAFIEIFAPPENHLEYLHLNMRIWIIYWSVCVEKYRS